MTLRKITPLLLSLALVSVACGDEDAQRPEPVVQTPPRNTYDDQALPRVDLPADLQAQKALTPPLAQIGADTGQEGFIYAVALGGYFIMRIQEPDGSFLYRYDPVMDEWSFEDSLPRQAGPTYTLSYIYEVTGRDEFRLAAEFSHARLASRFPERDEDLNLINFPNAHWIIGLVVHSRAMGSTDWADFDVDLALRRMGDLLLRNLNDDGSFTRNHYHPGSQYMQALWALYDHFGDEQYLDALEKAARYFYDHPEEHGYDMLLAVWGVEALMNLHAVRPADWIVDFVWKLIEPLHEAQILPGDDVPPEWIGGFRAIPRYESPRPGALSMYCTEATIDAFNLARRLGDTERAERYRNRALLGAQFLLKLQYRKGDTDHFAQSELILGGVPFGFERPALRVDITRHLVNTLLKVVTYLDLEDFPGQWPQPYEP